MSAQLTSLNSSFDKSEENLRALCARISDLPFSEMLLCRLILQMGRQMAVDFEQRLRPFGLTESEFRVLVTLFSQPSGAAHPSDLCVRADQSPANMSRVSDALVDRDLITRVRSATDRRRTLLRVTQRGEDLVLQLLPKFIAPLRGILAGFSKSERSLLISLLKRLHVNWEGFR